MNLWNIYIFLLFDHVEYLILLDLSFYAINNQNKIDFFFYLELETENLTLRKLRTMMLLTSQS